MNRNRLSKWCLCLLVSFLAAVSLRAAEGTVAPSATPPAGVSLSASAAQKRAPWQEHLTLGPGDTLNISLFEMADTARTEVPIGPDGRISFREAHDVVAAGLTVDELREKLDHGLTNYYRNPRTIITPAVVRSKRYIVLGTVVNKGVYNFDRPMTLIEAIARAGGFETGLFEQRSVELTDLSRSFLVRKGQRLPIDFEKLFQRGDLSQNIPLEPDDFLYFASAIGSDIYVLGEVGLPGVVSFAPQPTVLRVIANRGGFTQKAFRTRVLVVRGSLNRPQTFIVDTSDILAGKATDFKLEPRDIVYVSGNPWVKVADLIDLAAQAFIQSFTVTATTRNLDPIITHPLF